MDLLEARQERDGKNMKKIIGQIVFFTLIMTNVSFAYTYDLELTVGGSGLEARFNSTLPFKQNYLTNGVGVIYNDDDYKILDVTLALCGEKLLPDLRFKVGFKGLLGNLEEDHKEGDLLALSLLLSCKYSIPEIILPLPVDISAGLYFAPDSLCFSDSDKYREFRTNLDFYIITSGAITLGYRYIKAEFDNNYGQWDMSDGAWFIGYRMMY
ncbi:MAG: YfaZ family outer membrane protein [Desulfatiglandales bacterium]